MSLDSVGRSNNKMHGSTMTHSLSTPSGVDDITSAMSSAGGKKLAIRIQMLDDSVTMFQVQAKTMGRMLFDLACRQISLLEADYFGLEYKESGSNVDYWLDLEKPLNRQIGLSLIEPVFRFCVKFYTPDPGQLEEEFTRFLFCLQIKRDLSTGILQCNDNTAALMASYIVQASCGDYVAEDYPDHTYLSSYRFVPNQDATMQRRIMESHKKHFGQSPAEADLNLLETARRCELYGMKMHPAKDIEEVSLNLAVAHMGIAVFQGITRINTFSWAKIRKISFKRKRFLVKLHPEGYGYYKDTVEFFFDGRNECKNFWKKCVENHGFFRCTAVQSIPRRKTRVLSRGSSFRYSGKTQKQIVEFVRANYVKRQAFQRSQSFRQGSLHASSRSQSYTSCNVNSSISAHPLLPINTADWDYRTQPSDSTMPSQTKKVADSSNHRHSNPINHKRSQVTAAQVEIYPTKTCVPEYQQLAQDRLGSSRSVSPEHMRTMQKNHETDQALVHQDDHSSDNIHHGINGNMSLDRRIGLVTTSNHYSTIGSDKSSSHSKSEAGIYELNEPMAATMVAPTTTTTTTTVAEAASGKGTVQDANVMNNNVIKNDGKTLDSNSVDIKRLKWPTDRAYYFAKELLMTERTYKKDLDILNTWFRDELTVDDIESMQPLFRFAEAMCKHHEVFLKDLEQRVHLWETSGNISYHLIGDVVVKNLVMLPVYQEYIENHFSIIQQIHELYETSDYFQQLYKDFEQQKICYIPIGYLILKPLHRLLHYQLILERLVNFYDKDHPDYTDCEAALEEMSGICDVLREQLPIAENYELLFELQRDLTGFDKLVQTDRILIRQGCLLKHSKKGLQQRMFFLFSDVLLYGTKSPVNQTFKILGHVPVRSLLTEISEHNAFIIFGGPRSITVSAGTPAEKTLWLAELSKATADIKAKPLSQFAIGSLKHCSSSEEGLETLGVNSSSASSNSKAPMSRGNTATHVCWHRGATVGLRDHLISGENQFAGYLLRKFKNSSGWQKLWVVFTSFCLFFYKNYQDDYALASLPLLGYSVGPPGYQDTIQKEFVFKLSFKNHIYFFRAESEHTFRRWLEVLSSTTQTQDFKHICK